MRLFQFNPCFLLILGGLLPASSLAQTAPAPSFEKDILPILTNACLSCHGGLRQRGGLDLRTLDAIHKGGDSGTAVRSGNPEQSLLWQKIAKGEMPKEGKLSDADKLTLKAWIAAKMPAAPKLGDVQAKASTTPRPPAQVAAQMDQVISKALAAVKKKPATMSDDAEFFRRVSLDITGRLPTPAAARAFFASTDSNKRAVAIDELLSRPDFGAHWATVWHNSLLPLTDGKRAFDEPFLRWLGDGLNKGIGWDQIATDILCAKGPKTTSPQSGYLLAYPDADKAALQTSRMFLGVNLECAECHNHPMVSWKQSEYWGMAAFFSRTTAGKGKAVGILDEVEGKPVIGKNKMTLTGAAIVIPASALSNAGSAVKARFLAGPEVDIAAVPYRPTLAAWITAKENPFFAPAFANRVWAQFMGKGLVHPLDEFHEGNPARHPEILAHLAHEFRVSGHDPKHLIRCICNSQAYQRTSRTEVEDDLLQDGNGRMPVRLLSPEVLYAMICQVLGIKDLKLNDSLVQGRLVVSRTPRTVFVNAFDPVDGDPDPLAYSHGVLQVLRLLNQPELNQGGLTAKALLGNATATATPAQALDEMFLLALTRLPNDLEKDKLSAFIARQESPQAGYAGVLWMLMNYREFVLNH